MTGKKLRYLFVLAGLLILLTILWSVSDVELVTKKTFQTEELIPVCLVFRDNVSVNAYVKGLGIEQDGIVYAGGSSCNYLFNREGEIMGSFNYQSLLYMLIITEPDEEG